MALTEENLISIGAIIVGIISLILSYLLNRWTLKQSEKNLKTQLLYEDRKKAIFGLKKILENTDYYTMKSRLINYIDSLEGQFILPDLKNSF